MNSRRSPLGVYALVHCRYTSWIDFGGLCFLERDSDFEFDEVPQPVAKRRKVAPSHLPKRPPERKSTYVLYPDVKDWLDVP